MSDRLYRFRLLILSFTLNSYATPYVVFSNTLNIRSGPGTSFHIIGKLNKGDEIKAIKKAGKWVQIEWITEAWIYKKYITNSRGIGISYDQAMKNLDDYFTMKENREVYQYICFASSKLSPNFRSIASYL